MSRYARNSRQLALHWTQHCLSKTMPMEMLNLTITIYMGSSPHLSLSYTWCSHLNFMHHHRYKDWLLQLLAVVLSSAEIVDLLNDLHWLQNSWCYSRFSSALRWGSQQDPPLTSYPANTVAYAIVGAWLDYCNSLLYNFFILKYYIAFQYKD